MRNLYIKCTGASGINGSNNKIGFKRVDIYISRVTKYMVEVMDND